MKSWLLFLIIWWLFALMVSCGANATVPQPARQYQSLLTREARSIWGLDAPVAILAAQIQQESGWEPTICSKFACGLAQFTPATATWISGAYPAALGTNQPFNPAWAIRALAQYDYLLYEPLDWAGTPCDRWAFTLSAYNGGPGWIAKDMALCDQQADCDPATWWGNVELYSKRSPAALKENRGYPRHILLNYQWLYETWTGGVSCPVLEHH